MNSQSAGASVSEAYGTGFYHSQQFGSRESARQIVPIIRDLLKPQRVLDVGCGIGTWLSVFKENGVHEIFGVDGDYVNRDMLLLDKARFTPRDLSKSFDLGQKYDLVVSLEVAEHLPRESAETFVQSLVGHAPAVMFSAAVPGQGGTDHINEQWQHYWAALFEKQGYLAVDAVRPRVWSNPRVEAFYAQNIILYVHADLLRSRPELQELRGAMPDVALSVVHPSVFTPRLAVDYFTLGQIMRALPGKVVQSFKFRMRRAFQNKAASEEGYLCPIKL